MQKGITYLRKTDVRKGKGKKWISSPSCKPERYLEAEGNIKRNEKRRGSVKDGA